MFRVIGMTLAMALAQFAAAPVSQDPNATDPDPQQDMGQGQQSSAVSGQQAGQSPRVSASHQASIVLQETDQARRAISQNDKTGAMSHVQRALSATNSLQAAVPSGTQNVPIFAELEQTDVIGPLVASRRGAGTTRAARAARGQAQREQMGGIAGQAPKMGGAAGKAQEMGGAAAGQAQQMGGVAGQTPVVRETEGSYTSINLNVPMAKQHLQAAQTSLQNNNMKMADASLLAVQQSVNMISVQTDLPLVRARENLNLAQQFAQSGNMQQCAAPLQAAVNALQEYQRGAPSGRYKDQAAQLASQISAYTGNIEQQNTSTAPGQIQQWWNEVANWTQPTSTQ